MYKGIPYSNKIIKRREQQRLQVLHKQNLKNVRPLTTNIDVPFEAVANPFTNNKKKDMLQEDRFTEIERQNRLLLEKIHTIMNKKSSFKPQKLKRNHSINSDRQKMNKSLNQVYRKKQLGDIEIQNAKLLKRIMDKKSDYDSKKLKEEWKKQKQVIKNIANYPFIIRDRIYKGRKKSMTSHSFNQPGFTANIHQDDSVLSSPIQIVRIRNLSGHNFLITVKYDGNNLQILGDNKSTKEIKVIEIPKEEGLEFIQYECEGKIELIFDCLRYDPNEKILYLVGKQVDLDNNDQTENEEEKFNTDDGALGKDNENEEKKQTGKSLKKREMSNIYEIQNSQLETEPHKNVTEGNNNNILPNIEEGLVIHKNPMEVPDQNVKKEEKIQEKKVENQQMPQGIKNEAKTSKQALEKEADPSKTPEIQDNQVHEKAKQTETAKPQQTVQKQQKQHTQASKQQAKKQGPQTKVQITNQPQEIIPEAKVQKQESQQICGIKSEFELTSMLQNAIG